MLTFLEEHHYLSGRAPEREAPPHRSAGGGTLDPESVDGDFLLPPLNDPVLEEEPDDEEDAEEPHGGDVIDIYTEPGHK